MNVVSLILISLPVLAFAWCWGGARGDLLRLVMPWVTGLCAVGVFVLPQRRPNESLGSAFRRVWHDIVRDSFFYVALALCAYLCLPLFNVGLSPLFDAAQISAGANPHPPIRIAPFCVRVQEHAAMLYWFVPALLSALGIRHSMTRAGKRVFYELVVWNGVLLSVLGFAQMLSGAQFPFWQEAPKKIHFFSVFGYPNMGGAYFVLTYALALGLWVYRIGVGENLPLLPSKDAMPPSHPVLRVHYPFVAVVLLLSAVLATLCRAAISLAVLLTFFFCAYILLRSFACEGMQRARRFRSVVSVGLLMFIMFTVIFVYAPAEVGRQMRTVNIFTVSERVTGKIQYHTRAATAIMRSYPLFGVGGWGYRHFAPSVLKPAEAHQLKTDGSANVHNDYLQFLAELGAVGFGLIVACVWLLMRPAWQTWVNLVKQSIALARSNMRSSSLAVFLVEAPVLWMFLGSFALLIHAFGDCPFRSAAVLSLFFAIHAAVNGFLPRPSQPDDD